MKCELSYKKVKKIKKFDYSNYFVEIRNQCPFCVFNNPRTKTFRTLKQLTFHLSDQHKNEGNYFPFSLDDIHALMNSIALAKEWRLLP